MCVNDLQVQSHVSSTRVVEASIAKLDRFRAFGMISADFHSLHGLRMIAALAIFVVSYTVIGIGRLPGFRIDRASGAVIGAISMIAVGVLSLGEAFRAIDFRTIALLFGMMIVIAYLRLSGFFRLAGAGVLRHASGPTTLLIAVVGVSGFLSAFLVNDAICLALTPLVLEVAVAFRRNPVPYLLALAMASNVGSCATITGNPQNMIIGAASGISYRAFAEVLSPVAGVGLILTVLVIVWFFPKEFRAGPRFESQTKRVRASWPILWKSIAAVSGMIAVFFLGWPPAQTALLAAAFLLVTRRVNPGKVFAEIDWSLLALFTSLFIILAGVERTTLFSMLPAIVGRFGLGSIVVLSALSAGLSNLVSNVPAVLLLKPLIPSLADPSRAWLTLAMSSTLAGNFTVVGSVAGLIVVHGARHKLEISFWDYFKVGAPLAVITIAFGILWLSR
jgi:Na+/H+ antiporter NhaD/arsenite permease-like protein